MAAKKYIALSSGQLIEVQATDSSAGAGDAGDLVALDSSGKIASNMLPVGVGETTEAIECTENLSAGNLVNIYNSSGKKCRKADASTPYRAHGFVLAGYTSGQTADVYLSGSITGLSSKTPGAAQYLSTGGTLTETAPSTATHISQEIGYAESDTEVAFHPQRPITLA